MPQVRWLLLPMSRQDIFYSRCSCRSAGKTTFCTPVLATLQGHASLLVPGAAAAGNGVNGSLRLDPLLGHKVQVRSCSCSEAAPLLHEAAALSMCNLRSCAD